VTLPVAQPIAPAERAIDAPQPPQQVVLDAVPLASGTTFQTGLPEAPSYFPFSQGPEFGGGVGSGIGTGVGSGTGAGWGPGSGGGFGGGAYRLGAGVVPPTLLKQITPNYTSEALMKKIQGTVILEAVVSRDGVPMAIRIIRSLDPGGLDEEAIAAVRKWQFNPGRIADTPVDVLVTIWLDFRIN
jgi:TonB family protein